MANLRAAPSRRQPIASTELEAGRELKLGEFSNFTTLSLSEARFIIEKVVQQRSAGNWIHDEAENTTKTRDYLEVFATFKDQTLTESSDNAVKYLGLDKFEEAQMKSLLPTCADEAKALIPSLEGKVEKGVVDEASLDTACNELQKLKKQSVLY